jgi:class 3 adenylate cyclase/DNA-binding response OmpR family regulator/predicted ATPase
MRLRILVIAQDVTLRSTLARWLISAGYSVELAEGERRAREVLADHRVALTILAGGRSAAPGFDLDGNCGKRIVVTDQSPGIAPLDRAAGARNGYPSVPLDEQAVLTCVRSVLQPPPEATPVAEALSFDGFTIDLAGRSLHDGRGSEVPLTRSEFGLLVAFVRNPGRVLSRDQLLDAAVGRRAEPYDRSIDVLVGRLRKKIETDPKAARFILTVVGEGYKFAAKLREAGPPAQPAIGTAAAEREPQAEPRSIERRQLTILSCGFVEATALASRLDPEDLRAVIADYHRCCSEVVSRFGGIVATAPGDRVVAYFGYPEAHEHDAEQAVRAGLALIDGVAKLDTRLAPALHVRVGVASGLVVAGGAVFGEADHQLVAIGEAPGLAAQLEATAPPGAVVIAASTRQLVRGLFDYREAGPVALNGFAEPVPVWQVVGASAAVSRFDALRGAALTPLIGRDEELDLLLRRWRQIQSGEGRAVLISGEPGIGKSRLARALQDNLTGNAVLSFYCSPNYQDSALYPVIAYFERAAGFRRDDTPEERFAKFEALVHPSIGDEAVALIAALLSVATGELYPLPSLSPQRRKEKTLEALVAQLAALARKRPILAMFEDAHWMDPTSRELLDLIIDRARSMPVLLLITYRPEFTPPWASHAHTTTMVLNRLGRRHVTAMADQITGKPLPHEVYGQIIELSDGVPLFVEELVKTVLESGLLRELGDGYRLRGRLPAVAIPNTLRDSLVARLDRLGLAKEVAQTGAALGREFSHEVIRAVADWLPEQQLWEALGSLVQSELLHCRGTPPDSVYLFKHALLQDAAHETLLRSKRRELHARIAAVLEERFPEVAEEQPGLLAQHYTEAGSIEQAVIYWGKAGRQSAARSAMLEAETQLLKGLDLVARLEGSERDRLELQLQIALGSVLHATRGQAAPEAGEAYARACALCELLDDSATLISALNGQAAYYMGRGHLAAGLECSRKVLSLAERQADLTGRVAGHQMIGSFSHWMGDFAVARRHSEQALVGFEPEGRQFLASVDSISLALGFLPLDLMILGYPDQALLRYEQSRRWSKLRRHPHSAAYLLVQAAHLQTLRRDYEASLAVLNELIALATEQRFPFWLAIANAMLGQLLASRNEPEAGLALCRRGVTAYAATGALVNQTYFNALLAQSCVDAGRVDEAFALIAVAQKWADKTGERWFEAELHRLRGEWLLKHCNDTAASEACFYLSLAVAREQSAKLWELRATVSFARLMQAGGRHDEARKLLEPIYDWFTEGLATPDLKEAKALLEFLHA